MRGLAACYSEHAIKVSDTYCSGPSNHSYISPTLPPSIPDTVTTTYTSSSSDKPVSVSLTWSDNLTVVISTPAKSYSVSLKKQKGSRKLTSSSGSLNAEIFWDLTEAEYDNGGPEPIRGFSVVVAVNSEVVLRVGDVDQESLRRENTSWRVSRTERYSGNCWLSTKAKFSDAGSKHEIQIQCGGGGGGGGGGGAGGGSGHGGGFGAGGGVGGGAGGGVGGGGGFGGGGGGGVGGGSGHGGGFGAGGGVGHGGGAGGGAGGGHGIGHGGGGGFGIGIGIGVGVGGGSGKGSGSGSGGGGHR